MTFPRNRWFDVRLVNRSVGVHFLKWTRAIKFGRDKYRPGIGVIIHTDWFCDVFMHFGYWVISLEHVATYADWPWNRRESSAH